MATRKKSLSDLHNQYMRIFRQRPSFARLGKAEDAYYRYAQNIKKDKRVADATEKMMTAHNAGDKEQALRYANAADSVRVSRNSYMGLSKG